MQIPFLKLTFHINSFETHEPFLLAFREVIALQLIKDSSIISYYFSLKALKLCRARRLMRKASIHTANTHVAAGSANHHYFANSVICVFVGHKLLDTEIKCVS